VGRLIAVASLGVARIIGLPGDEAVTAPRRWRADR